MIVKSLKKSYGLSFGQKKQMAPASLSSNVKAEQAYHETFFGFSNLFHGHLKKTIGIKVKCVGRNVYEEIQHGC